MKTMKTWKKFIVAQVLTLPFPLVAMFLMKNSGAGIMLVLVAFGITVFNVKHFAPVKQESIDEGSDGR